MKNAKVLEDHFGDDGHVLAGKILIDVSKKRFDVLEKLGLIREATDDEVEAGDDLGFVSESDHEQSGEMINFDVTGSDEFKAVLADLAERDLMIEDLRLKLTAGEQEVVGLRDNITSLENDMAQLRTGHEEEISLVRKDLEDANARAATAETALEAANAKAAGEGEGGEKQRQAPSNKKAADAANKAD